MNILILIPARYASTRFPGKPLADLGGKPVIRWVVEKAAAVSQHVYVATDDERIRDCVESFGGRCVMTSAAHRSGTDRCYEAYCKIADVSSEPFDVVVNVQGDEPFIHPDQIRHLASSFVDPYVQIATLAKSFDNYEDLCDPNKVKVVFSQETALYFSRSVIPYYRGAAPEKWLANGLYYKHVGMYAYRPSVLREITALPPGILEHAESLEQLRWLENGYKIAVRTTEYESIGIDTPDDLVKANACI